MKVTTLREKSPPIKEVVLTLPYAEAQRLLEIVNEGIGYSTMTQWNHDWQAFHVPLENALK